MKFLKNSSQKYYPSKGVKVDMWTTQNENFTIKEAKSIKKFIPGSLLSQTK